MFKGGVVRDIVVRHQLFTAQLIASPYAVKKKSAWMKRRVTCITRYNIIMNVAPVGFNASKILHLTKERALVPLAAESEKAQ